MTNQLKATYGQEYKYTTTELINNKLETISSGVAAWEPSIGGDENPHRKIQRYVDHNKAGPYDFGAIEMPLGEMFYPGAMVGYSRVEVLSIHRDTVKNLPTRQVTEFYTNKDFPYKSSATDLTGDAHAKYDPPKIMQLLKIDLRKNVTLSQGFLIETNDMNGKEKGHATYTASDSITPVSYTRNYYNTKEATDKTLTFNHTFPVIAKADGLITNALIGRDIELMTDFREHTTQTISRNIDFNFDMAMWGPYPIPICMVLTPVTKESTMYRSAAVLKIVTHFGMLDSVVVIDKGSMVSTKNLVYDAETGNPLLTRTQNEHNKPVYNFSYPAHWAYSGMGPAYRNIDAIYTKVKFTHGILTEGASNIFDILESGDEIYTVSTKDGLSGQTYTPPCDDQANITPENAAWTSLEKNPAHRIWAVGMAKVGGSANSWVFMDEYGNPYNAKDANIRIVRSGKRNMLDQSVGAVTSLVDPRVSTVINNTVNVKLAFNEATKIIQTSAATFKDNWRVDNSFYKAIESVINNEYARVHRADLYPDGSDGFLTVYSHKTGSSYDDAIIEQNTSMHLYKYSKGWSDALFNEYHSQIARKIGFLRYSYNTIPTGAKLYKAMLSLYSHTNNLFTTGGTSSSYPPADHPGVHTANGSQNNIWMLGEVYGLNKDWYPTNHTTTNAWTWINNYFNSDPANVTTGKGIIPYCTSGGWDSYFFNGNNDNRINITLPLKTITGSTLASLKKIGLKVRLENDEYQDVSKKAPEVINYRCFWSPNASTCQTPTSPNNPTGTSNKSCESAKPMLSYYYYKWGITTPQNEYLSDPTVNTMLTRHVSTTTGIFCRSKFTERKSINPYTEGVLGNWRVDSTYAYYGERKETVPDNPVDTRTGGTIKDYTNFWNFAPINTDLPITRNQQAGNVWVWNSAITQYNRKGYEIENTDPLGRFNSGLYGYNQQLPVAVANNARVREIMFDSFEDYSYQTTPNCTTCKPHRNFNYSTDGTIQIDPGQKHTGANSLRVNAGKTVLLQAPVSNTTEPNKPYGLKIKPSTISYTNPQLGTGGISGTGLTASYYNHAVTGSPMIPLEPASSNTSTFIIEINPVPVIKIPPNSIGLSPATGVSPTYFSVKWHGRIQAPATAMYYFSSIADNGYRLTIGSTQVSNPSAWGSLTNGNEPITTGIPLIAGNDYAIEICYYNNWGPYQFDLRWKYGTMSNFAQIPTSVLYPPGTAHFQNIETVDVTCNRLDSIQVTGNALTDTFSLLQGKKMLLSAWVKVGTANCCFPPTYADNNTNSITINYNEGSIIIEPPMKPSGRVIEGWQRYESDFIVPLNATNITVSLNNTTVNNTGNPNNDIPVFFDDIRIQPFNANMKSFVYHPSNLRLMAELDENNYASYYEYDDDGTLTRVKKETVKGIKTITETRSATQKKIIKED